MAKRERCQVCGAEIPETGVLIVDHDGARWYHFDCYNGDALALDSKKVLDTDFSEP